MEKEQLKGVFKGMGVVLLCHLGLGLLSALTLGFPIFIIGLAQLAYVLPLALVNKTPGFAQGVWIAAAITFLLNAACFGLLFSNFNLLNI